MITPFNPTSLLFGARRQDRSSERHLVPAVAAGTRAVATSASRPSLSDLVAHRGSSGGDLFVGSDEAGDVLASEGSRTLDRLRNRAVTQRQIDEQAETMSDILDGLKELHELMHHLHEPYLSTGATRMDLLKTLQDLEDEARAQDGYAPLYHDFVNLFGSKDWRKVENFIQEGRQERLMGKNYFSLIFESNWTTYRPSPNAGTFSGMGLTPFGRLFLEWPEEFLPGGIMAGNAENLEETDAAVAPLVAKYMTLLMLFIDTVRQQTEERRKARERGESPDLPIRRV